MADPQSQPCPERELIEAYAHDRLDAAGRRQAQRILEQSEPCRELFRRLTAGRYPRLPNYTIIGQVGKGGFGVVYKAVHHAKERTEALKVLFSKTPLLTSYFQNEVHLIARLKHPNIATLFEAQLSTPPLYYTMEFVEGERLNEYLKGHEASLAERIEIIKKVARATGYAHSQGVIHRDLKPQNILIDADGEPHIVDFGIAKKLAEVAPAEQGESEAAAGREGPVGTLGYIAPEQQRGQQVDGRADIYALGALLFHCITGEPARLARLEDQRLKLLRERRVTLPEDLSAIIGRCLADDPDQRYQSCEDFVRDLDNYLAGRPIEARSEITVREQARRVISLVLRHYVMAVRVSSLVLAAALITWLFWHAKVYAMSGGVGGDHTVIIGVTESTLEAIDSQEIGADLPGLSRWNLKSWRMLYGRVLERLAVAQPAVVAIDGWMEDCTDFDGQLLRGIRAIDAPVVLGAIKFDVNGEPEMCPAIRDAIHSYGTLCGTVAAAYENEYEIALGIQRGFEFIPGFALAAFAAARFPRCDAVVTLNAEKRRLQIRYRLRNPRPGQPRWELNVMDVIPYHRIRRVEADATSFAEYVRNGWLWEGDISVRARIRAHDDDYWQSQRVFSVDQVLKASDEQLKRWFNRQAIILALMVPGGKDEHERKDGSRVFGCQVQAEAVNALLARTSQYRFTRGDLTMRTLLWCGLATLVISLYRRERTPGSLGRTVSAVAVLALLGLYGGLQFAAATTDPWGLEVAIALTAVIVSGSLAYLVNVLHEHEKRMAPAAVTPLREQSTLDSTVLAETR